MSLTGAFLIFMYGTTFQTSMNAVLVPAVLMGVIGFSMAFIVVNAQLQPFKLPSFLSTMLWTLVSVLAIWTVNKAVPLQLETLPLDPRLFAVLMGVMEEVFFRLWLCPMFYKFTRSKLIAILVSALTWTVYHLARYGGQASSLMIVLLSGCILGVACLESRSADSQIFAHGVVNYWALSA